MIQKLKGAAQKNKSFLNVDGVQSSCDRIKLSNKSYTIFEKESNEIKKSKGGKISFLSLFQTLFSGV